MNRRGGLGDILVEERLIAREQLNQAKRAADRLGTRLVMILLDQGLVSESALVDALVRSLRMELFDVNTTPVDLDAVREVPFEEADRYRLLPLSVRQQGNQRVLKVAMADPLDTNAIEDIEFSTGSIVEPVIARSSELADAIRHYYRGVVTKVIPVPRAPAGRSGGAGIPRGRGHTSEPLENTAAPARPPRQVFGGGLDDQSLRTKPVQRVQKMASPVQRVDALVSLLVHKGLISQEEYEDQLRSLIKAPEDER